MTTISSIRKTAYAFLISAMLGAGVFTGSASAAENTKALTPQQTLEMVNKDNKVLFVDVRDPVEIMFIGHANAAHINIPFMFADKDEWDEKNGRFKMKMNPDFAAQIKAALDARGLDTNTTIITMCRSGSERGMPSAQSLIDAGFPNVFYVDHGFQGDASKEGPKKGMRVVNGWQNSGLPWSTKINPEFIYMTH
jgi:rhodanese-related sulfurtransferase